MYHGFQCQSTFLVHAFTNEGNCNRFLSYVSSNTISRATYVYSDYPYSGAKVWCVEVFLWSNVESSEHVWKRFYNVQVCVACLTGDDEIN